MPLRDEDILMAHRSFTCDIIEDAFIRIREWAGEVNISMEENISGKMEDTEAYGLWAFFFAGRIYEVVKGLDARVPVALYQEKAAQDLPCAFTNINRHRLDMGLSEFNWPACVQLQPTMRTKNEITTLIIGQLSTGKTFEAIAQDLNVGRRKVANVFFNHLSRAEREEYHAKNPALKKRPDRQKKVDQEPAPLAHKEKVEAMDEIITKQAEKEVAITPADKVYKAAAEKVALDPKALEPLPNRVIAEVPPVEVTNIFRSPEEYVMAKVAGPIGSIPKPEPVKECEVSPENRDPCYWYKSQAQYWERKCLEQTTLRETAESELKTARRTLEIIKERTIDMVLDLTTKGFFIFLACFLVWFGSLLGK